LLVFLKPAEVYAVIEAMRLTTQEISNRGEIDDLRWHFTISQQLYNKTLASYVDTYVNITFNKNRSVLKHCSEIGFDFTQYVDSCFRNMMTDYLPMSSMLDYLMIFLTNGIKSIYRMTYAITKLHKEFIKKIPKGEDFISQLAGYSRKMMPQYHEQFLRYAFKYPIGSARRHKLSQQEVSAMLSNLVNKKDKMSHMIDYLPNAPIKSTIIKYKTYAYFWMMVPAYIRIRIP